VSLYVFENDGKFHVCTCRNRARGTKQIELGHCTALEVEHSKTARARQIETRIPIKRKFASSRQKARRNEASLHSIGCVDMKRGCTLLCKKRKDCEKR